MNHSKTIKTLAILGSPHRNGITAKMLDIAIAACQKRGDEITYINLYEKNIRYCQGCSKCFDAFGCVMRGDDMDQITQQVKECDLILLAAPVYWGNVPAVVKNLFDRLRGTAMLETSTFPTARLKGKECLLLTSCNTAMPFAKLFGQSSGALRAMHEFFKYAGFKCKGKIVCASAEKRTDIPSKKRRQIARRFR